MTEPATVRGGGGTAGGGVGMNILRLVLRPGTRFPVALAAIAVGLVVAGWLVLQQGTPIAPELRNQGYIGFYISDPEARVDVSVSPSSGPGGEVLPGYRWLSISMLVRSGEGPVWWAVALGEGARFPPGDPVSGTMPGVEAPGEPTYFVNDVEWPTRADPDDEHGTGTVIFGKQPEGGYFQISFLTVKVAEPLVRDVGEYVTLSTPTLGRNDYEEKGHPRQFYNRKADAQLLEMLSERTWHVPKRLELGFDAEGTGGPELVGVRQEDSGTAPVAPFRKLWRAKDTLKVDASFSRPSEDAKNERRIFLAGVLVSLAASFFVWALELWFGPERNPVAALRRRP